MTGFVLMRPLACCMTAAALAAGSIAAAPSARAGEWIADKSGCRVWNPNPQLDELVTWSGSCSNGRAEGNGILRWLKGNIPIETDEGEWRDGRQVNKGTHPGLPDATKGNLRTASRTVTAY